MATLSTLKVNRITSRDTATEVQIDKQLNMNNNPIVGALSISTNEIIAPSATQLKAGIMSTGDKAKLDNIEAQADVTDATNVHDAGAIMESEFAGNEGVLVRTQLNSGTGTHDYALRTDYLNSDSFTSKVGYVKSDGSGALQFDNSTFLVQNDAIKVEGDADTVASGTTPTNLEVVLNAQSVVGKPQISAADENNDRILMAQQMSDGSYELRQISPKNFGATSSGGSSIGSFDGTSGINREAGESGTIVTLELNNAAVQGQPMVYGDGTVPNMQGTDEVLIGRSSLGLLHKTTLNQLGTWFDNTFGFGGGGGGGGGGTTSVTGLAVYMEIDTNGNLNLIHTGGLTSSEMYINANSELVAVVT